MRRILIYDSAMDAQSPSNTRDSVTLNELPLLGEARILSIGATELSERLAELGFLPGERVRVLARALFGDPIAVRLGSGTFALRRFEAASVAVEAL
jgi:ferrous iron transport protein A